MSPSLCFGRLALFALKKKNQVSIKSLASKEKVEILNHYLVMADKINTTLMFLQ